MTDELTKYVPVQALIIQYNIIKAKFEKMFADIDQISLDLKTLIGNDYAISHHLRSVGQDGQIHDLRQYFWRHVFDKLQLYNLMSEAKKKEFDKQMQGESLPEFNEENIQSTFKNLTENVHSLMEDTILEAFEIFRPHHARHKTNTEYAIGKRAIMEYIIQATKYSSGNYGLYINYNRESQLRSVDNAFSLMDGCGPIKYPGDTLTALKEAMHNKVQDFETKYFKCRWHYNGTIHFTFKRMDLVAKMNAIGGKGLLNKEAA